MAEGRLPGYLSLFGSVGTLVCCALPSLLVLLGFGTTVAALLADLPWLVTVSRYKAWVFAGSGALLAANAYYVYRLAPNLRARALGCAPGDPACAGVSRPTRALLWLSVSVYLAGFLVAYVLGPLLAALDQ